MNQSDWSRILDLWTSMGLANVDAATAAVSTHLSTTLHTNVYVTIPYPDTRQRAFGVVDGRELDFAVAADRIAAVVWWVDKVEAAAAALGMKHASIVGYYWFLEDLVDVDVEVLQAVSAYLKRHKRLLVWIPSWSGSGGDGEWAKAGEIWCVVLCCGAKCSGLLCAAVLCDVVCCVFFIAFWLKLLEKHAE